MVRFGVSAAQPPRRTGWHLRPWTGAQADNDIGSTHRTHIPGKCWTRNVCESLYPKFASPQEVGLVVLLFCRSSEESYASSVAAPIDDVATSTKNFQAQSPNTDRAENQPFASVTAYFGYPKDHYERTLLSHVLRDVLCHETMKYAFACGARQDMARFGWVHSTKTRKMKTREGKSRLLNGPSGLRLQAMLLHRFQGSFNTFISTLFIYLSTQFSNLIPLFIINAARCSLLVSHTIFPTFCFLRPNMAGKQVKGVLRKSGSCDFEGRALGSTEVVLKPSSERRQENATSHELRVSCPPPSCPATGRRPRRRREKVPGLPPGNKSNFLHLGLHLCLLGDRSGRICLPCIEAPASRVWKIAQSSHRRRSQPETAPAVRQPGTLGRDKRSGVVVLMGFSCHLVKDGTVL